VTHFNNFQYSLITLHPTVETISHEALGRQQSVFTFRFGSHHPTMVQN
jgi:hypothetical protein